jgi:lysozyme family protein
MANWKVSFDWMMDSEDPARAYAVVPDAPPGAFAVSGINSAAFPGEFEAIAALAQNERALAVEQFYERNFWNQWFAQIDSDEVAKRVFDASVNMGSAAAVRCLQKACNEAFGSDPSSESAEPTDGKWGPNTIKWANALPEADLVSEFQQARCAYYDCIVAKNPADAQYLNGWLARAKR